MAKAVEQAYAIIREAILSGEFNRGDRLREEDLAQRAGVSRTPVREALRRLDSEGLVAFAPNRGASVTAWSEQELDDLYEARALVEGYAAEQAAKKIGPEQLGQLESLSARMHKLAKGGQDEDMDQMSQLNNEFHRIITAAGGNSHLESLVRSFTDATLVYRTFRQYSPERLRASMFHHDEVIVALRARDGAWANAIIRSHILAARSTVQALARNDRDAEPPAIAG